MLPISFYFEVTATVLGGAFPSIVNRNHARIEWDLNVKLLNSTSTSGA